MKKKLAYALSALFVFSLGNSNAQVPANSEYKKDPQTRFSRDLLNDNFEGPNVINCYLSKAGIREMVGKGRYQALVDSNKCEGSSSGVQDTGQGSAATTPKYEVMMVESYIENNSLKAKMWMNYVDNWNGLTYQTYVSVSIDESDVNAPPYGKWRVDYCDTQASAPNICLMFGFVEVNGKNVIAFDKDADDSYSQRGVAVIGNKANGNGYGKFEVVENNNQIAAKFKSGDSYYRAAFTSTSQNSLNADKCYSPNINNPNTRFSMWDTYLYDTQTGAKVDTFAGFRVKRESSTSYEGYASFWGVNWWSNSQVDGNTLANGTRIIGEKGPNGEKQATTYEYTTTAGKLRKISVAEMGLIGIDGKEFMAGVTLSQIRDGSALKIGLGNALYPSLKIKWNESLNKFQISGFSTWTVTGQEIRPLSLVLSIEELVTDLGTEYLSGWVMGSDTNYRIQLATQSWSNNTFIRVPITQSQIKVRQENNQFVMPGDIPSGTLYCAGNCLVSSTSTANVVNSPSSVGDAKVTNLYYWDTATGNLKYGNSSGANVEAMYQWYGSNKLLAAQSDLDKLGCDPSRTNDNETVCPWNDSTLTTWYQWESGDNVWNRQQFLKVLGSNTYVKFSAPLQLAYQVPDLPINGSYAGKQASVQYPGAGQLWVPGKCVDRLDLTDKECGGDSGWVHEFIIPTTESPAGKIQLADGSKEYLVKWLNMGVFFAPLSGSEETQCKANLNLNEADSMTLPVEADFRNPASPESSNYLGPWVNVSGSPAVIDGTLQ